MRGRYDWGGAFVALLVGGVLKRGITNGESDGLVPAIASAGVYVHATLTQENHSID